MSRPPPPISSPCWNTSPDWVRKPAPHPFDEGTLHRLLTDPNHHLAFIAREGTGAAIIAHAVARLYYEPYEPDRFKDYGWIPNDITDAFYAPSVADDCQGQGMGRLMMEEVLSTLKENGRTRILLWGGIQATHEKALANHLKVGFQELGGFEWNGWNFDMALDMVSPEA